VFYSCTQQKPYKALEKLKLAEESNIRQTGLYLELGKVYLQLRRYKDAERAYSKGARN
jgi:cytochrome c-type biogenesis protein CcmH/NrfG